LCNHAIFIKDKAPWSILSEGPGRVRLDNVWYDIKNPKKGQIV
jgi:hypothetical protein